MALMPRSRRKPKEVFSGPRLAVALHPGLRARSFTLLVLVSVVIGVLVASALAGAVWYLVQTFVHAGSGTG
jgi:hypothetical protein